MDENTAWQNFVETGSVSDYLAYCKIKLGYPSREEHDSSEEFYEDGYGSSDTDRPDRWR